MSEQTNDMLEAVHTPQIQRLQAENAQLKADLASTMQVVAQCNKDLLARAKELEQAKADALAWKQQVDAKNTALQAVHGELQQAKREYGEECMAHKLCADTCVLLNSQVEQARQTGSYWKAELHEANKEVDKLKAERDEFKRLNEHHKEQFLAVNLENSRLRKELEQATQREARLRGLLDRAHMALQIDAPALTILREDIGEVLQEGA